MVTGAAGQTQDKSEQTFSDQLRTIDLILDYERTMVNQVDQIKKDLNLRAAKHTQAIRRLKRVQRELIGTLQEASSWDS